MLKKKIDWEASSLWFPEGIIFYDKSPESKQLIKEEYVPIKISYENISDEHRPQTIRDFLQKSERMIPAEIRQQWEEESREYPRRRQYNFDWTVRNKYYPNSLKPLKKLKTGSIGQLILESIAASGGQRRYKELKDNLCSGYQGIDDMTFDVYLRRLEQSGLLMRPKKGMYKITRKGINVLEEMKVGIVPQIFGSVYDDK
jgi:hypothetical protein